MLVQGRLSAAPGNVESFPVQHAADLWAYMDMEADPVQGCVQSFLATAEATGRKELLLLG